VGNTVVINGVVPTAYNGSYTITALGNKCPGGSQNFSFCFNFNTVPVSPDVTGGMTVDAIASVANITSLSRAATTCPAGTALVSATSAGHTFTNGQTVSLGGTPGANESAYIGSFAVSGVVAGTSFNYTINTSPACTDNTAGMTAEVSGVSKDTLVNWVRGKDSLGDEASPGNGITIRPSVHGEVLHSRPAVIAYATTPAPNVNVVVFYGSNDGVFRAVNGNQTGAIGGVPPGGEMLGFIPSEFYTKLSRQYFNSPIVKLHNTSTGILPTPQPKDYFFDGSIGVFQDETVSPSKAYIFLSARRGGRLIYAIDVSDPTNPKFMWKRTNADTGFSELGQTWSQPRPARVQGYANPVLIFGAGYSPTSQDAEPPTADTMGRGIFILDALDGSIVWRAGVGGSAVSCKGNPCLHPDMTYSIPSDITFVDRNPDGLIDRLFATDMGGNVWGVGLETATGNSASNWQMS
jgi:type IV pilus assembly protein PilY1